MDKKFIGVLILALVLAVAAVASWSRASEMGKENAQLKAEVTTLQQETAQLTEQVNRQTAELASVRIEFNALRQENDQLKTKASRPARVHR